MGAQKMPSGATLYWCVKFRLLAGATTLQLSRGVDSQDNGAGLGNIEDKSKSYKSINAFEQFNTPDGGDWRKSLGGRA